MMLDCLLSGYRTHLGRFLGRDVSLVIPCDQMFLSLNKPLADFNSMRPFGVSGSI